MANIISAQTAAANSSDFTVVAGGSATICLIAAESSFGPPNHSTEIQAYIQYKSAGGVYITVGVLTFAEPAKLITGPGTYRVHKGVTTEALGVDSST